MLNNFHRLLSPRQWGISLAGLGLLLAFGCIGNETEVVSVKNAPFSSARIQKSSETSLLSRLRQIREHRSQQQIASADREIFGDRSQKTASTSTALVPDAEAATKGVGVLPKANFPTRDGIYLYGQSPKANQIGQAYIIFQKQRDRVTGALYMPQSEFNCFQGTLDQSGELAMTVSASPNDTSADASNQVATSNRLPQVGEDELSTYAYSVALQDFHRLNSINAGDRRILQMCK
ncbi:MAG: hypothetical protein RMY36_024825 [Nostoc sp. SerVER01]|uniref:hypothetical protein n=1 Tax=Nostoc sp. CCY 9925 TaxID=3103865 RepID=UPI002AD923F5|nr:hypothetical protein [Nostoc sp. SerVER01]MDZ8071206.1 hypothetical protein [Nostoc sp. DedQUE01]MDZ8081200.1 hypothetical protein [Nostoc sp. DcaGUA01]MDZ8240982.1 hypothetical protein [Nostoc sp. ChiQUE01a]